MVSKKNKNIIIICAVLVFIVLAVSVAYFLSSSQKFAGIPKYPCGEVKSVDDASDGYQLITMTNTNLDGYNKYKEILNRNGYTQYAEHNINNNYFSTYKSGNSMIHFYFIPYSNETRIISSSNAQFPPKDSDNYTKVCDETLTQVKIPNGFVDALGYIYRLEDGSFLVIDGGRTDTVYNNQTMTKEFYDTLESLAVNKNNIEIRAWFFSHPHIDHIGVFREFCELTEKDDRYKNVKIDSFIYNFVDTEKAIQNVHGFTSDYKNFREHMSKSFPDTPTYKAMPGQVYNFPGIKFEILYSFFDFMPLVIGEEADKNDTDAQNEIAQRKGDGNLTTTVSRIHSLNTGHSFLCTADSSETNNKEIYHRYENALKSDICSVNHHGHNRDKYRAKNNSITLYNFIDPKYLFFPATLENAKQRTVPTKDECYDKHQYISWTATSYIYNKCLPNVYIASERHTIKMKDFSIVE